MRSIFTHFWFIEVVHLYLRANPGLTTTLSIASRGYILRCLNIIAFCGLVYGFLHCYCCLLAVVAVATNISEPYTWPYPFGNWKDAYTIRRIWGYVHIERHVQ